MTRSIIITLTAVAVALAIAACGGSSSTTKTVTAAAVPTQTVTTTQSTQTPAPAPAPTPAPTTTFPPALASAFLKGCEQSGSSSHAKCGCELSYIEANVSLTTLLTYKTGTFPAWIEKAYEACASTV